jgi:hypothetical protein
VIRCRRTSPVLLSYFLSMSRWLWQGASAHGNWPAMLGDARPSLQGRGRPAKRVAPLRGKAQIYRSGEAAAIPFNSAAIPRVINAASARVMIRGYFDSNVTA